MSRGNELARPLVYADHQGQWVHEGMTIREAFAMAAMQGMCADRSWDGNSYEVFAKDAVKRADALIEALKETP